MPKEKIERLDWWPDWFTGTSINEGDFCQQFLAQHKLVYTDNAFFTPQGRLMDESLLKKDIYQLVKPYIVTNVTKKITSLIELLKITARTDKLLPQTDRIHLANGTLFLDGRFTTNRDEIVRSRFPVRYNPNAAAPVHWLGFLDQLLYPEDIATLQEYVGYCLIPSNKGQRMMVIKGNGGEGKSQIGAVLSRLFGNNAKDGSVGKISENRFARADLEHIHLMIDDDMRMEALKQTNYMKSLVTAQGKMDLERKGKQSYQGWIAYDDHHLLAGECKYRSKAAGPQELDSLKLKAQFIPSKGRELFCLLASKSGFTDELLTVSDPHLILIHQI